MTSPLYSEITVVSLFLIKVSFVIPIVANLRYGCKIVLKIIGRKKLVAFICKQLANLSKCL